MAEQDEVERLKSGRMRRVPRWLLIGLGVVLIAWGGFEVYLTTREIIVEVEMQKGYRAIDMPEEEWCAATDAFRRKWRAIDGNYVPDCSPDAPWRKQHAAVRQKIKEWEETLPEK